MIVRSRRWAGVGGRLLNWDVSNMFGAVLRVSGSKANVASFLARTEWKPLIVFFKGQPRYSASPRLSTTSGFNVTVSNAEGLKSQVRNARRFLRIHSNEFRRLKRLRITGSLDFGLIDHCPDGPQSFTFPNDLIVYLAACGIDLEVSFYGPPSP